MDFEDWLEELIELAYQRGGSVGFNVERYPFIYEDYHEKGMTPLDALEAEWG